MSQDVNREICPVCQGKKVISGTCEFSSEWRGTGMGDDWEDCQCTPELKCPACQGTGFVESDK